MSDGVFLLALAGILVSSASILAFVRAASSKKNPKKTSLLDLSQHK